MLEMPEDGAARQAVKPVICYPVESLPKPDMVALKTLRQLAVKSDEVIIAPRDASCFDAPAGSFFRISSIEGHKPSIALDCHPLPRAFNSSRCLHLCNKSSQIMNLTT